MSVYLIPLALAFLVLGGAWLATQWVLDRMKRASFVASSSFDVQPRSAKAHDTLKLTAKVTAAGGHKLKVQGVLVCALLEHRERRIHEHAYDMEGDKDLTVEITMPDEVLKSGVVGNDLSNLFSEDVHRALIQWFVEFQVRGEDGEIVMTRRVALDVPEGRALTADRKVLEQIIIEKCANMHSDLVFNWLVHIANIDGSIADAERSLLRKVLASAHGVTDEAEADKRIDDELDRKVGVDPLVVKQHMPPETLHEFYRLLYAMAWRDGEMAKSERQFLDNAMRKIGLDKYRVDDLEREVLADVAAHAIY